VARDTAIFNHIGLSQETRDAVFAGNLRRFLGVS
jgi:hypothetical protein